MKSKPTDALGRQWRWFPEPKEGDSFRVKEEDYITASYWTRYCPVGLPTWMGLKATKLNPQRYQQRTGQYRKFGFFIVEDWQTARLPTPKDRHILHQNPLINRLSESTIKELKKRGLYYEHAPHSSSSPKHDAHVNYIYGSFMENLPPGWKVEWQHELLTRLNRSSYVKGDGYFIDPDATFILTRPNGKQLLCFLEHDQDSQPVRSPSKRISIKQKLDGYIKLIQSGDYKKLYNFDGGALLLLTTLSQTHLDNMLKVIEEDWKKPCNFIMGRVSPFFDTYPMVVPHQIHGYANVYTEPWYRSGFAPFIFHGE